jgi:hypothetical protein
MNKKIALTAICALALMSASPALALNKGRVLSGVEAYNSTNDGTITSTFQSSPVLGYTLQITSPSFSSGIAGVNAPAAIFPAGGNKGVPPVGGINLITVTNFTSYTCDYTIPSGKHANKLLAVTVQNAADGQFYTAQGKSVTNGSVVNYTVTAAKLQNNGLPVGATVCLADLLFFGGSDTKTQSITASNFAVNGHNTISVANGFFVFQTNPDLKFNFNP